ncbi:MAG TPA: hypothetical protein VN043_11530 [Rhodanobacter sp.]|nr:hypothetical protein [Rhodanobacter sp.]
MHEAGGRAYQRCSLTATQANPVIIKAARTTKQKPAVGGLMLRPSIICIQSSSTMVGSVVVAAKRLPQQQECTDGAGDNGDRGGRMPVYLATQAAVLIIRFVGEILGGMGQLPAVVVAAIAEAFADASPPAFEQSLCGVARAIGVFACTLTGVLGSVTKFLLDITVAHGGLLRQLNLQPASTVVTSA